ncbi:MAG TPA: NAD-dependent epimerase/dehydratase family protein [Acidimicrobiia bacterium]|nr:NAD-dependent epimerase/dehydratase family protein [Acidimicrobiia bacterium]
MRVLVTGMGGELGTRVAQLLEQRSDVDEIVGVDFVPPRRRLLRSEFRRIDPRDSDKLAAFVTDYAPTVVAHYGVYEPDSRLDQREAAEATASGTLVALEAAARGGRLLRVAVRSGLTVYGRGPGRPAVPDESVQPAPTTPYGRTCLEVEAIATGLGRRHGIPVSLLRMAPVVGSHVPSPLGRLLRLPAVPVPALADPPFSLLHQEDAARAMVEALCRGYDGPLNIVGPGAASPWQVVRLGGRVPVPMLGPSWKLACRVAELAGAPVPPHVLELMQRGRTADGGRAIEALGLAPMRSTQEVCAELYEWATVTALRPSEAVA